MTDQASRTWAVVLPLGLCVTLALGVVRSPAEAHNPLYPRLVHVQVSEAAVDVAVLAFLHPGGEAARTRARFDRSGDGVLDATEQEALVEWLDQRARERLVVRLDGVVLEPVQSEREFKEEQEGPLHEGRGLVLRSVHRLALQMRPGIHEISVRDVPRGAGKVIPLRLDLPTGSEFVGIRAEGAATPLSGAAGGPLQGGFAGSGGTVFCTLVVPERTGGGEEEGEQALGSQGEFVSP